MTATSAPKTFGDLYTMLLEALRADKSSTSGVSQAKRAINIALQDMHLGTDYKVPWAERRAILRTQDDYTTGTVTTTKGSTTVTGDSTLWNTANSFGDTNALANGKMVFSGSRAPYTVQTVSSDTAIVLADKFAETSLAASAYTYFKDEYDLESDFLRMVDLQTFSDEMEILLISRTEFRRRFPDNTIPGRPNVACLLDYAPSGNATPIRRVRFASPPNDFYRIPYSYITSNLAITSTGTASDTLVGDADEPIVPVRYRMAILYHALYCHYRDRKDDSRSQEAKSEYVDLMSRLMMDVEVGAPRPRLQPRIMPYVRSAQRPYRRGGSGRRYDVNGRFDRMEDD